MVMVRIARKAFLKKDAEEVAGLVKKATAVKEMPSSTLVGGDMQSVFEDALVNVLKSRFEARGQEDLSSPEAKKRFHRGVIGHVREILEELFDHSVREAGRETYVSKQKDEEGLPLLVLSQQEYMRLINKAARRALRELGFTL